MPKKKEPISFLKTYFDYLENPIEVKRQSGNSNYPSSASIEIINSFGEKQIIGSCLRREGYRRLGIAKTDFDEVEGLLKMKAGKYVEIFIVQDCMKMGIYRGSNTKFRIEDLNISGETDIFVEINKKIIGIELKTSYGDYFDVQVLGAKPPWHVKIEATGGYPKLEHLLQLVPYLFYWKKMGITDEFRLIYFNRGSFKNSREYTVTMDKDGYLIVDGVKNDIIGLKPIAKRFKLLDSYMLKKELPPRDFYLKYPESIAKNLVDTGRKKQFWFNNWKKDRGICGDWMCGFCGWKKDCWKENKK